MLGDAWMKFQMNGRSNRLMDGTMDKCTSENSHFYSAPLHTSGKEVHQVMNKQEIIIIKSGTPLKKKYCVK